MTIQKIEIYQYALDLKQALQIKDCMIEKRKGLLIRALWQDGRQGLGEISPLSGLHRETLRECIHALQKTALSLPGRTMEQVLEETMPPSMRYGLEMAQMHEGFCRLAASLQEDCIKVPVCALLFAGAKDAKSQAARWIAQGVLRIKIKVARQKSPWEAACINTLSRMIDEAKSETRIRLDANACWDLDQALAFARLIDTRHIEYIEDPLRDLKDWSAFARQTGIPIAVDEYFGLWEQTELAQDPPDDPVPVSAVIIKPNVMGGFHRASKIIRHCRKKHITCVLSNAFESGLSISAILLFALQMGLEKTAVGIDTLKYFKKDLLKKPLAAADGAIDLSGIRMDFQDIDWAMTERIC